MKRLCLIASLLLWFPAVLVAQPLTPGDFARGMHLEVAGDAPLQVVVVPRAVYETVTRADLGDLRVFNGSGEELPHAVYRGEVASTASARYELPFFPVRGRPGEDLGDLSVQVRRTPSGALVQVEERSERRGAGQPVRAYVADASDLDVALQQLSFFWDDTTTFITDVVAETSDDLRTWQRWGTPATLAYLRYGDNTLHRNEMKLPPRRARYIRLSWPDGRGPAVPERLVALAAGQEEPERRWARFEAAVPEPGVYRFDQEGVLPVDRVRFDLPQPNTLARAVLASAASPEGPWRQHYQGLVYRLRVEGHDLTTPSVAVPRTTDRYWRLTVNPAGGGLGQRPPVLELGWTPERLLFVPRGAPPYTLAFGRAGAALAGFDPGELLHLLPDGREALRGPHFAAAGPVFDLGGAARLEVEEELPWRRILLWCVLLLGVVLLATLSVRLLRQLERDRQAVAGE